MLDLVNTLDAKWYGFESTEEAGKGKGIEKACGWFRYSLYHSLNTHNICFRPLRSLSARLPARAKSVPVRHMDVLFRSQLRLRLVRGQSASADDSECKLFDLRTLAYRRGLCNSKVRGLLEEQNIVSVLAGVKQKREK